MMNSHMAYLGLYSTVTHMSHSFFTLWRAKCSCTTEKSSLYIGTPDTWYGGLHDV